MTVYIPSYFNGVRERESNFYKILEQYLSLGYNIVLYWMNGEFTLSDDRIKLIKGSPVNASVARNVLLKEFYNSNDYYAIFSDDDTHLNSVIIPDNKDCVSFTNDYHYKIEQTEKISSAFILLSNLKKKYDIEVYFDESLEANQDLDFGIILNKVGIKTYRNSSKEVTIYRGSSSMFKSNMNKLNKKQKSLNYIINKHGKYN